MKKRLLREKRQKEVAQHHDIAGAADMRENNVPVDINTEPVVDKPPVTAIGGVVGAILKSNALVDEQLGSPGDAANASFKTAPAIEQIVNHFDNNSPTSHYTKELEDLIAVNCAVKESIKKCYKKAFSALLLPELVKEHSRLRLSGKTAKPNVTHRNAQTKGLTEEAVHSMEDELKLSLQMISALQSVRTSHSSSGGAAGHL